MANQQKNQKNITRQNVNDFLEIEGGSSSLKIDDKKNQYDLVRLAYGPNELYPELNSVKGISVHDHQHVVPITADVIAPEQMELNNGFKNEIANITRPIGIDLHEINGEFYQPYDPASSNEKNKIKNDVVKSEQAQFNIEKKITQVLNDKHNENNNNNTQTESSIQQSSNSPTKIQVSQCQQSQKFCSTSSDSKEDSDGKKPRKDVCSLIDKFEQMGTVIKSKK